MEADHWYIVVSTIGAAYPILAAVFCILVLLCLWYGMRIMRRSAWPLLVFSTLFFSASRMVALVLGGPAQTSRLHPEGLWGILNLASFVFLALALTHFRDPKTQEKGNDGSTGERAASRRPEGATVILRRTGYFAVIGAFACLVFPQGSSITFSLGGTVNTALFTATAGPVVFLFRKIRRLRLENKPLYLIFASIFTLSWLLTYTIAVLPGEAAILGCFSKIADILALAAALVVIHIHYVRISDYHKRISGASLQEAEKAREELARLSKIASDIYEDNNALIRRQKEQTYSLMRRVENLEKILQIGITIQKRKDLGELLQMIVELVRDNLGFNTVILRLLNELTQSFETKAYVGLGEEAEDTVVSYRMPMSEYERMIDTKCRISKSYFLRSSAPWHGEELRDGESILVDNAWSDIDLLIVPLLDDSNHTVGYLSVENPENTTVSVVDVIENLEIIASLAVIAIRNAKFFRELENKNEKLKSYASKLASLNKMKSNFVATISHEFRTPLTSIKAYCETLVRSAEDIDRKLLKEFLVVIEEESNRLMSLIEDILDFSKMESGAIKFDRAPCNLNEVIVVAAKEVEKNFERKNITLLRELPHPDVVIRAERDLMKQLLINLLHNASKFTPDGGKVTVRLEDETVSTRIIVEDTGIGIPEDQMDKIFDHFHQVERADTREHGGSGLGLAICRNIVDWHDGRIWVEYFAGGGARFITVIPKKQVTVRSHALNLGDTVRRMEVERYLEPIVEIVAELVCAKRVSVMLLDSAEGELRVECAIGLSEEVVEHARVKPGEGIAGKVLQEGTAYLVEDIEKDPRVRRKNNDFIYDSKSFLSVPVKRGGQTVGVVNVSNHTSKDTFNDDDRRLLELFTQRIAMALERLEKFASASDDFAEVRGTFKAILDTKRYIDIQNAEGITEIVMKVADKLGLDAEKRATLRYILNIYDLGLAKVGYHIIRKPGELSPDDRRAVEEHALQGTQALQTIEISQEVRDAVLYHHENYDGTGYPGELSGEAIPIEARIIRIADSLRALISHRPYQKKYSPQEASEVLKLRSGNFYDPKIIDVFLEVMEEHANVLGQRVGERTEPEKADIQD